MILYDQNHNFIGMSNETLSYLGYEDLSDFTSQHSDFANLLVNKEGYIYKFQNFSWIDFILYSGSPNKSALLQLKSGEPLEVKLSVKEVHLINELGNSSKLYSIRILSDNFVNIAAKTDANIAKQSPPQNQFNLNSLITEEETSSTPTEAKTDIPVIAESSSSDDFILNFPSSDSLKEEESPVKLDFTEPAEEKDFVLSMPSQEQTSSDNDFKLNLSESILDTTKESKEEESALRCNLPKTEEFILSKSNDENEQQTETESNFSLNFLKEDETPTESAHVEDATLNFLKPTESQKESNTDTLSSSDFKLKHVTMNEEEVEEKTDEKITLNFLKDEVSEEVQEPLTPDIQENKAENVNLDFLQQTVKPQEEAMETTASKNQIIAQIQNDIKEIDEVEEESHTSKQEEKLEKEEIEHGDIDAYLFNKNEVKKEKKSFTKTLQSLFSETSNLPQESKEEELMEVFQAPAAVLKNAEVAPVSLQKTEDTNRFPTLASLGLEKEEENDLIFEFVNDTKENIKLFKDYYKSGNVDQAEYTLIKMQSSANILNLNDIIITLANVKQSCTNGDSETIEQLTATLDKQVKTLESYLESETV